MGRRPVKAADVMAGVVTRLVAAIEAGAGEWAMPWRSMVTGGWPVNAATGNRYSAGALLAFGLPECGPTRPDGRRFTSLLAGWSVALSVSHADDDCLHSSRS